MKRVQDLERGRLDSNRLVPIRPFLTAHWRDLLLVTWKVEDALLEPYLPPGVELDLWEDSALVSLVAFHFENTRVLGIAWPGFRAFPELNLRFYVRKGSTRGVCFIREYVPSALVAGLARGLYNEPYRSTRYSGEARCHELKLGGRLQCIRWEVEGEPYLPEVDTAEHFIKEHEVGFGKSRRGKLQTYRVEHPRWRAWPRVRAQLDCDFAQLYGPRWAILQDLRPWSTIAVEGSEVRVFGKDR